MEEIVRGRRRSESWQSQEQAEPLLQQVPENCEEYAEAYRLLKFLKYFKGIPYNNLPPTSLLREFLGGSSFHY
jgi:uridine kinase